MSIGSVIEKMPPWVVGTGVVAVVAIVAILFFSGRTVRCTFKSWDWSCGPVVAAPAGPSITKQSYQGYYYTYVKPGEVRCSSEEVLVSLWDDKVTSDARVESDGRGADGKPESAWNFRGYFKQGPGATVALAYTSERQPQVGDGVYYLRRKDGHYLGIWIGLNKALGNPIACPYVMTGSKLHDGETCESRWPLVFTGPDACHVFQ